MENLNLFSDLLVTLEGSHLTEKKSYEGGLQISGEDMDAFVQKVVLEEGLTLFCWRIDVLRAHRSVLEFKTAEDSAYMLEYYFQPPNDRIKFVIEEGPIIQTKERPFLLLYSNKNPVTTYFSKPSQLQCLAISISHSWLLRQLRSLTQGEVSSDHMLQLLSSPHQRTLSRGEVILSKALFNELLGPAFLIEAKAHLYNLLTYLYRQVKVHAQQDVENHYRAILTKVEKRIMASLYTNLPPINELAKEFYMSFSTLNRQFKDYYGATIYDYYLQQKMLLAQKLLKDGQQSVNAVAFQLGYESVTHFISIFKKIHGYSPGQLKKNTE